MKAFKYGKLTKSNNTNDWYLTEALQIPTVIRSWNKQRVTDMLDAMNIIGTQGWQVVASISPDCFIVMRECE